MKKTIIIVIAAVLTGLLTAGCSVTSNQAQEAQKPAVAAICAEVEETLAKEETTEIAPCEANTAVGTEVPDMQDTKPESEIAAESKDEAAQEVPSADDEKRSKIVEAPEAFIASDKTSAPDNGDRSESELASDEPAISDTATTSETDGANEDTTPVAEPEPSDIECVDGGDESLAPFTPADDIGTPNPFANPHSNGIVEIPADDLIQPGDDKPGEGIHF
ncbi:MAG TPA: hypothetical protein PLT66_02340 [Bacillota bacterium]|nr:hypothetical protein [Bacillota bacterium]